MRLRSSFRVDAELALSEEQAAGELRLAGYALFHACDTLGVCRFLRRDLEVRFVADPGAQRIR